MGEPGQPRNNAGVQGNALRLFALVGPELLVRVISRLHLIGEDVSREDAVDIEWTVRTGDSNGEGSAVLEHPAEDPLFNCTSRIVGVRHAAGVAGGREAV